MAGTEPTSMVVALNELNSTSNVILPNSGLSEVTGIVSDTVFRNTVSESRIVTPVMERD